jgi:hypothetical protein
MTTAMTDGPRARRKGLRAVVVIVAFVVGALVAPAFCPRLDLASVTRPESLPFLATFEYPAIDRDRGSDVRAVFEQVFVAEKMETETTVVFGDEDQPCWLVDRFYKLFRWVRWKRLMDVETFQVERGLRYDEVARANVITCTAIRFPGVFAGDQRWDVFIARHLDATVPIGDFARAGDRPVICINTWNHMFGPRTTNADRPAVRVSDYPIYHGSRAEVEALFARYWETVWWRPFAVIAACVAIGVLVPLPKKK